MKRTDAFIVFCDRTILIISDFNYFNYVWSLWVDCRSALWFSHWIQLTRNGTRVTNAIIILSFNFASFWRLETFDLFDFNWIFHRHIVLCLLRVWAANHELILNGCHDWKMPKYISEAVALSMEYFKSTSPKLIILVHHSFQKLQGIICKFTFG